MSDEFEFFDGYSDEDNEPKFTPEEGYAEAQWRITEAQIDHTNILDLSNLNLKELPAEIWQLDNLLELELSSNILSLLPPEIGHLSNLSYLNLNNNRLKELPPEIGRLSNLSRLSLAHNRLRGLPAGILQLSNLSELSLDDNELSELPAEILQLSNLSILSLSNNRFQELPSEIGQLSNLSELYLYRGKLRKLPVEIGQLSNLSKLSLFDNVLKELPVEIGQLNNLSFLFLQNNELSELPVEIGQLNNLSLLRLEKNNLSELPVEIGQLVKLESLFLQNNNLRALPVEIGNLAQLDEFDCSGNPLKSPPPEIINQGTEAILRHLRALQAGYEEQWISKLMVVGEGGVGKTSLLKNLRGEAFDEHEDKTPGVAIREVEIEHLTNGGTMILNAWDFGGQDHYLATHQFFLTDRCAFLLLWNARLGWEQGKIRDWLKRIHAAAPNAPILLVATHVDQNDARLPLAEIQREFPNVQGNISISNHPESIVGIDEVYAWLQHECAELPLMGVRMPTTWLAALENVNQHEARHIPPNDLWKIMQECGVAHESHEILARWLHDLGEILFFGDDSELSKIVFLKPQWVVDYIYDVLDDPEVLNHQGILSREDVERIWSELSPNIRDHFLHLMQKFDMSYLIPDDEYDRSLVVERLEIDENEHYYEPWQAILDTPDCKEISLRLEGATLNLPGIPTWFIARSHRFTQHIHWRYGVLFGDDRQNPKHLALIKTTQTDTTVTVRGSMPHNFFALMRDGLEYTLRRFPGLEIKRKVPCPCLDEDGQSCSYEFDYEYLERVLDKREMVECQVTLNLVPLTRLLYGLNYGVTNAQILESIDRMSNKIDDLWEYVHRGFTTQFRVEQEKIDSHCPNVFTFSRRDMQGILGNIKTLLGEELELQLWCQAPGHWHPALDGGKYVIPKPHEWLLAMGGYMEGLVKVLKFATPFIGPWLGAVDADVYTDRFKAELKLTENIVKQIPDIDRTFLTEEISYFMEHGKFHIEPFYRFEGAQLRALRRLLNELDPDHHWGGLNKVLTPEGHFLWLCDHHADEYKVK